MTNSHSSWPFMQQPIFKSNFNQRGAIKKPQLATSPKKKHQNENPMHD
jgi:hypothetical protein